MKYFLSVLFQYFLDAMCPSRNGYLIRSQPQRIWDLLGLRDTTNTRVDIAGQDGTWARGVQRR